MIAAIFSCEHATCAVPEAHRELFRGAEERVTSVEGWDPGALNLAQGFAMKFRTPLVHGDVTRLLIDLEQDGDARWSSLSAGLPEATRLKLIDRHERPYRQMLQQRIEEDLRRHSALMHVRVRTVAEETGQILLEVPKGSVLAAEIAGAWRGRLAAAGLDVRLWDDVEGPSLTDHLAGEYPAERYAPIGLKVAQSFFLEGKPLRWETVKKNLLDSLTAVLAAHALNAQ
jgi:hypothetical protein